MPYVEDIDRYDFDFSQVLPTQVLVLSPNESRVVDQAKRWAVLNRKTIMIRKRELGGYEVQFADKKVDNDAKIIGTLRSKGAPVSAAIIRNRSNIRNHMTIEDVENSLERLVQTGKVFRHETPDGRSGDIMYRYSLGES